MPRDFDNGNYTVTRKINYGGESDVYLVKQGGSEMDYVVKMMRAHYPSRPLAQEALQEAEKYNEFEHPHVAKLVETFVDPADNSFVPCMVLEYYPFGDLQKYMDSFAERNAIMPEKEAARFGMQIAKGLEYVHNLNIIHADLKPANILLRTNDHCVIADFGISKRLQTAKSFATLGGGTLTTFAPETFSNKITTGSDIWALGVILFQMLVPLSERPLQPLFQVCEVALDSFLPLIDKTLRNARKEPEITEPMIELICDMLKRESHQRPTAAVVATRLEAIFNGTAVSEKRDPAKDLRSAIQMIKSAGNDKDAIVRGFNLAREAAQTQKGQEEVQTTTWTPVFEAIKSQLGNYPAEALSVFVGLSSGDIGRQLLLGYAEQIVSLFMPLIKDAKSPVARTIAQIIGSLVGPGKDETRNLVTQTRQMLIPQILGNGNVLLEFLRNFKSDNDTVLALSTAITHLCTGDPGVQQQFCTPEAMTDLLTVLKDGKLEASAVTNLLEVFFMFLQEPKARENFLQIEGGASTLVSAWERHANHGPLGMQGCKILDLLWGERVDKNIQKKVKEAFKEQPKLAFCLLQALAGNPDEAGAVSAYENLATFLHVHQENAHKELYKHVNLLTVLLTPLYNHRTNPKIAKAAAAVFQALRRVGRPVAYVLLKLVEPQAKFNQNINLSKQDYEKLITELMFTIRIHTLNCFVEPTVKQQLDMPDFGFDKPLDISGLINVLALVNHSDGNKPPEYAQAMLAIVDRLRCVDTFDKWTDKRFFADDRGVLVETIRAKGGRFADGAKILDQLLTKNNIPK